MLLLVLAAEFVNGWADAPNAIATVVSTRVLSPFQALGMAAVLNVVGTMSGTAVAATIGKGIVKPEVIGLTTDAAAMVAIVAWSTVAWHLALPTSESHALVAGLSGTGLATAGTSVLVWEGWRKVLIGLVFSTFLGFLGGLLTMTLITSIMGVGSTRRFSAVRWGVGAHIVTAWVFTFPVCGIIAWGVTKLLLLAQ